MAGRREKLQLIGSLYAEILLWEILFFLTTVNGTFDGRPLYGSSFAPALFLLRLRLAVYS